MAAEKVYEDDDVLAFNDLYPVAPVHILIIPKTHIAGLDEVQQGQENLLGKLLLTAKTLAAQKGLKDGYRLLTNIGVEGGQTIRHLHFHLIGGRKLEVKIG